MEEHVRDDFYSIDKLSVDKIKELYQDALDKSYSHHVDILDVTKSWARQRTEMSFEEVMAKHNLGCHNTFIHRKGFQPKDQNDRNDLWRWKLEIGFSTFTSPDYYLYILVDQEHLDFFVEKYDLKKR